MKSTCNGDCMWPKSRKEKTPKDSCINVTLLLAFFSTYLTHTIMSILKFHLLWMWAPKCLKTTNNKNDLLLKMLPRSSTPDVLVGVQFYNLSCSILIVNHCVVLLATTKREPNLICHSLWKELWALWILQNHNYSDLLSDFACKFQSSMTVFHCRNIWMQNHIRNGWIEIKLGW